MAKMPGLLVAVVEASMATWFCCRASCQSAIGPSDIDRPKNGRSASASMRRVAPSSVATVTAWSLPADPGREDHGPGLQLRALRRGGLPEAAAQGFEGLNLFAQVIDGPKGRGLCLQPHHQLGRLDAGKARDVVDRFLGIERRALAPGV